MALWPRLSCSARTDFSGFPAIVLLMAVLLPALTAVADGPPGSAAPASNAPGTPALRWRKIGSVNSALRVFCSPVDADTVFVWTSDDLLVSSDGGTSFGSSGKGLKEQLGSVTALLVNPVQPSTLYAGTAEKGVFVSSDGGQTFRPLAGREKGLTHVEIYALAFAPNDASFTSIYATHGLDKKGLSMTIDGGKSWRTLGADFGAAAISETAHGIFFAGKSDTQGAGFYRYDPTRAWFCVLLEQPTALLTSRLNSERVWLATESSGLRVTEDAGISMRQPNPGPQNSAIVSLVGGIDPGGQEVVYAYDPAGHGVLCTRDDGKTFQELNNGFEPTDWTRAGAMLAGNADGSVLYACRNGELYRGAPASGALRLSSARVQPAAVVPGTEAVTITCRAAPKAVITVDCSAVDGPAVLPMKAGEVPAGAKECLYTATLPPISPMVQLPEQHSRKPGPVALRVTAQLGAQVETRAAVITLLPVLKDIVIYKGGDDRQAGDFFGDGRMRVGLSEKPSRGAKGNIRLSVTGVGTGGFNWPGTIDTWNHKLLIFYIRSDQLGAPDLFLSMLDDAGGTNVWSASQHSKEVDLSRYIARVSGEYQFVAIPMIDFTFGSQCSPRIRQMYFRSAGGAPRSYDIDEMALIVKPGPTLEDASAVIRPDLKAARLRIAVSTRFGELRSVTARVGDQAVELFDDGKHEDREAGDRVFGALLPLDKVGRGPHQVVFSASDDLGVTERAVPLFVPARAPVLAPEATRALRLEDGEFNFADAPVLHVAGPAGSKLALDAKFVHQNRNLYCMVDVTDPGYVPRELPGNANADDLAGFASVEIRLRSPATHEVRRGQTVVKQDHRIVAAPGGKRALAAIRNNHLSCISRKTERGYVLQFEFAFGVLDFQDNPCDFDIGTATRLEIVLNGADGSHLAWASPDAAAAANADNWGVLRFTDSVGPARFVGRGTAGNILTLVSNKRLDRTRATDPGAYRVAGMTIQAASLGLDNRTVDLTATTPWKRDQVLQIEFPGVRSFEDLSFERLAYTVLGVVPATDEFVHEFLIGEARKTDPLKLDKPVFDEKAHPRIDEHWRYARADERVDLVKIAGPMETAAVPAHLYVHADAERVVQLWLGSDDGARVAVNGKLEHVSPGSRAYAADQEKIANVHLKKGWNDVMITISQMSSEWEFSLRIRGESGGTPEGISYSAEAPAKP